MSKFKIDRYEEVSVTKEEEGEDVLICVAGSRDGGAIVFTVKQNDAEEPGFFTSLLEDGADWFISSSNVRTLGETVAVAEREGKRLARLAVEFHEDQFDSGPYTSKATGENIFYVDISRQLAAEGRERPAIGFALDDLPDDAPIN
jgi:hypothetical protein